MVESGQTRIANVRLFAMVKGGTIQRAFEKYLFNPMMRMGLRMGIAPKAFALLETTGRRSGLLRRTPVGSALDGSTLWLVAEHGERCAYVKNLVADPRVRVKIGRAWHSGTATLMPVDDGFARRRTIDKANGLVGWLDGLIFRASASDPTTIRIDLVR
jgi:deazaflavin-dependent oxidoreductase (nitroreductase family)